jgi:hypothetical protein
MLDELPGPLPRGFSSNPGIPTFSQ